MINATKTLALLAFLLLGIGVRADSVEPDLRRAIREAQRPRIHYGPARVGWNGQEKIVAPAVNPVYESLRVDSPAAIRRQLKAVVLPHWQVAMAFLALILGLRMMRSLRQAAHSEPASNVVPFPARSIPREEAA
ncbi:MAG TPA: hypothetical protein VMZ25_02475 [Terriglobales bacterium]|nr:hypothetical protein [Terriglobales bacterium]